MLEPGHGMYTRIHNNEVPLAGPTSTIAVGGVENGERECTYYSYEGERPRRDADAILRRLPRVHAGVRGATQNGRIRRVTLTLSAVG